MNLTEILNWRYTSKEFDRTKKISEENLQQVKNLLQLSASSTNLQPWHFIIAETEEGKKRFSKATQDFFKFNEAKILNASHVVAFCAKTNATEEHLQKILEQEDKDGRFSQAEHKQNYHGVRNTFRNIHKYDLKDLNHWIEKQVYLNVGSFLLGVATLGIDATPMEGFDMKAFDEEFNLREKGLTSICLVSIGYRAETDFNAKLPKSRLPQEDIIDII